jgi:aryl carrier-like protein
LSKLFVEELAELLCLSRDDIEIDTDLLELGLTAVNLIQLHYRLQRRLLPDEIIPLPTIMAYHTIRGLAEACQQRHQYIPAVALQPKGGKSPLWLVHAAAGEALIFINLARLINDQPVYAFKARGFVCGEIYFTSIDECVRTYYEAIKELQPHGPHAILEYSYGGMLAFELAKIWRRKKIRFNPWLA